MGFFKAKAALLAILLFAFPFTALCGPAAPEVIDADIFFDESFWQLNARAAYFAEEGHKYNFEGIWTMYTVNVTASAYNSHSEDPSITGDYHFRVDIIVEADAAQAILLHGGVAAASGLEISGTSESHYISEEPAFFHRISPEWDSTIENVHGQKIQPMEGSLLLYEYCEVPFEAEITSNFGVLYQESGTYLVHVFAFIEPAAPGKEIELYQASHPVSLYVCIINATSGIEGYWFSGEGTLALTR